jgi:hypothetical protein
MTAWLAIRGRGPTAPGLVVIVLAAVGMVVAALIEPKAAAAGWLSGFAFWSQVLVGSLALAMIHRLTSGRWGEAVAPVILSTAAATPLLLVLAIPMFIAIPALYPWAGATAAARPDVLSYYLNAPLFIVRAIIAMAGWSALAILLPRLERWTGQLVAAIGLVFHCVVISSVAIDWYLSLEVPFTSSSFGASVAIIQLIAALAWAILFLGETENGAVSDIGGLLLAFVLGITYVDFMAVLVIWYGDLPNEESWFVLRQHSLWPLLAAGAFILATVVPIVFLLLARVRASRSALRWVAVAVLVGLALYDAYLIAPPFGVAALIPALLATVGIGLLIAGIDRAASPPASRRGKAVLCPLNRTHANSRKPRRSIPDVCCGPLWARWCCCSAP